MTKVTEDQFELRGNCVVHIPTRAEFTAYSNRPEPHLVNWGDAGNRLTYGRDYDRDDVARVGCKILASRKLVTK